MGKRVITQTAKRLLLHLVFPVSYIFFSICHPVRRKVLFLELRYDGLTDNLRRLRDRYAAEGKYEVCEYFLGANAGGGLSYVKRCLAMTRALADAKLVYVDESSNVLAALPIRPKTRVIQVWHACGAFKRFGYGLPGDSAKGWYGAYDLVSVSSEDIVPVYTESMGQREGVVRPLGVSRTDVFFEKDRIERIQEEIRQAFPEIRGRKIVLFAPTFRGNVADAKRPDLPEIARLGQALSEDYIIFYKGHPAVKERVQVPEKWKSFFLDVTGGLEAAGTDAPAGANQDAAAGREVPGRSFSTEEYLCAADLLITDYSSLVFDCSLFLRPMLFYAYDFEEYDRSRGFYYPYAEFVPGPICKDTEELIREMVRIRDGGWNPERVRAFRARFMGACDGHATERIMREAERL